MYFEKEIETLPLKKLRKLQNERLKKVVDYVYHKVPFYKKTFDKNGIKPGKIKGIQDLHRLPFTYKSDLRDNYPFGLFAVSKNKIRRIHCSSGTTGKPIVAGYTKKDLKIFSEVVARSLITQGAKPGMKLQNAYGYGLFTGGLGLHYGAELLGMTVVPVSGGMTDRQIMLIQDFKPEVISCTPSYALTLAEEFVKRNIAHDSINLKYALLGAEPWTEAIREKVDAGLNVISTNIYGLSEIIGPGVSSEDFEERGSGSYIWEDHFFPEVVDKDSGEPVEEGKYGVLVFTTLTKEAMPLLRYVTNDITNIYYEHSKKRTHIKMGPIRGRSDDMLIIRGVNLFPTQIEEVIKNVEFLTAHYQIAVSREGTMDEIEVRVEVEEEFLRSIGIFGMDELKFSENEKLKVLHNSLSKKIKENIGLTMKVSLKYSGEIPRSEGGKLNRTIDLRKK